MKKKRPKRLHVFCELSWANRCGLLTCDKCWYAVMRKSGR